MLSGITQRLHIACEMTGNADVFVTIRVQFAPELAFLGVT